MKNPTCVSCVVALTLLAGCATKPILRAPHDSAGHNNGPAIATHLANRGEHTVVAIAKDIREACGIEASQTFFGYNSTTVVGTDQGLLGKLASCFNDGPLKGRQMRLVGHADPRGDGEYNYLLGQRRADAVRDLIVHAGLVGSQVVTTSRGENEAVGQDEPGWAKDRRVEVVLGDVI